MTIYRASCTYNEKEYEYFYESDAAMWQHESAAQRLIQHTGIFVHRSKPQTVDVQIERFYAEGGSLQSRKVTTLNQDLPFLSLTEGEYEQEMTDLLDGLSSKVASFVRNKAWDDFHSSGYESVLNAAKELIDDMHSAGLL